MKNYIPVMLVLLFFGVITVLTGCTQDNTKTSKTNTAVEKVRLCKGCGQIKGSAKCCKPGEKCPGCKLIKGSPGCCKIPKDVKVDPVLCAGCGHIKGSEKCCKPAPKCGKCNLIKGSPGCCNIPKKAVKAKRSSCGSCG